QRAIVELVVQRGRSYETLAEVLQVPSERVRELARDALTELSPRTASRVDAERRGQVADYLLRQQSADEERSTRDYLKQSETASAGSSSTTTTPSGSSTTAGQQPVQVVGGIALNPVSKTKAQGVAYIVQQGNQRYLVVQAQVPPLPNNQKVAAYEVWLYNSNADARSLGAQYTNAQGVLQGRAPLPADVGNFKSVDISRELFADKNAGHSNNSLLRGDFSSIKQVQQPGGAATTPGGASTTPSP